MRFSTPKSLVSSTTSTPIYRHRRRCRIHAQSTRQAESYGEASISQSQVSPTEESTYDDYGDDEEDEADDGEYEELTANTLYSQLQSQSIPKEADSVASSNRVQSSANFAQFRTTPVPESFAYVNIAPLPIFRGESGECPVAHLTRFARVCRANNALSTSMKMRIFPVTLDGDAAIWYELNIEPYPSLPWEEIKSSFLQMYRRVEFVEELRSELMMIGQADGESVNAFFMRMQWILKKWPNHGIPDVMLKGIFIDGLKEDFQDWVIPHKPNSLDEALRLALAWEQAMSIRAARRRRNVTSASATVALPGAGDSAKCGFCDGEHDEGLCEIRQKMRELWLRSKDQSLVALNSSTCGPEKNVGSSSPEAAGTSMGRRQGEDEKEGEVLGWSKSQQCQCWKHQCWKKKAILTRNYSTAD